MHILHMMKTKIMQLCVVRFDKLNHCYWASLVWFILMLLHDKWGFFLVFFCLSFYYFLSTPIGCGILKRAQLARPTTLCTHQGSSSHSCQLREDFLVCEQMCQAGRPQATGGFSILPSYFLCFAFAAALKFGILSCLFYLLFLHQATILDFKLGKKKEENTSHLMQFPISAPSHFLKMIDIARFGYIQMHHIQFYG